MKASGKTVLITGGSSGIGLALAQKFLENANTVIVTGRNLAKLEEVRAAHPELHIAACDGTDLAQVHALAQRMEAEFGGIDVLVNNAGVMYTFDIGKGTFPLEKQLQEVDINVSAPIRLAHVFLPQLKKSKEAAVVNVSSGLAYVPFTQAPVYSGTKAAIHFWTLGLRLHLKPHGIQVIELLPPVVDTPLAHGAAITDDRLKPMPPEVLAGQFWKGYLKGQSEILPGVSRYLKLFSRMAPGFIFKQLNKQPVPKH